MPILKKRQQGSVPPTSTTSNVVTNASASSSNPVMRNIKPLFSQVASNNNPMSCASPSSQVIKRQRLNKICMIIQCLKKKPNTQLRLKSFDSSDPQSQNKEIDFNQDDGFTLAGKKDNARRIT